ncbi:sulfate transporter, partial [Diaphorobacter sp. DS2]
MNQKNQRLLDYIQENSINITDMWLSLREKQKGSIYSADADPVYEQL